MEDAELAKKETQEGLPGNVQDFKDHPYYALERHLKRHEIIWPKREVGKINAGKSASSSLESVYRRNDVQTVRSADKWYRFGREIKPGEQALKHVPARSKRGKSVHADDIDNDDDDPATTALYAYSQTALYIPPPIVRGRVPKNVYGNLDVYVPSMIPPGGLHVRNPAAAKAARLIGVDYADAVTGFQFKGRHGTAITAGVIVAAENKAAVEAVIDGFQQEQEDDEARARSMECLRLWKRFLTGLRIGERIGLHSAAATDEKARQVEEHMNKAEDEAEQTVDAGGFFRDGDAEDSAQPTASRFRQSIEEHEGGGFMVEEDRPEPVRRQRPHIVTDEEDEERPGPVRRRRPNVMSDEDSEDDEEQDDDRYEDGDEDDSEQDKDYVDERIDRPRPVRRRRPVVQSDGEEEEETTRPPPVRRRRPMIPSDDEDEHAIPEKNAEPRPQPTTRARRKLVMNGDDSGEETYDPTAEHELTTRAASSLVATPRESFHVMPGEPLLAQDDATVDDTAEDGGSLKDPDELDTHDYGGGFIPDEDEIMVPPNVEQDSKLMDDVNESGGGFFAKSPATEDGANEPVQAQDPLETHEIREAESHDNNDAVDLELEGPVSSSEDEHGSLPSHDPEDDDAEPDWLDDV